MWRREGILAGPSRRLVTGERTKGMSKKLMSSTEVASKGGKARAESMTAEQRTEIAQKAANTRWSKTRVGSTMSKPLTAQLHDLQVDAEAILDQVIQDPANGDKNETQIEFFALRTQLDTLFTGLLNPDHHAIMDLRQDLTIPTKDILLRILGILQGCLADVEAGMLPQDKGPRF